MISFSVADMTCGHCVSSITQAVKAIDHGAQVRIDLVAQRVEIEPAAADAAALSDALKGAGYSPVAIERHAGPAISAAAPSHKGCCCG